MDFTLSSSAVLGAAVLLWLLWVAPFKLRRLRPAVETGIFLAEADGGAAPPVSAPAPRADPSEEHGRSLAPSAASKSPEEGKPVTTRTEAPVAFRIRWDRCALAGLGLGGLLIALVGGVFAGIGLLLAWIPLGGLALTASTVVVLRRLAIGDRRRRASAAARRAPGSGPVVRPAESAPFRNTATEVFDHRPEPEPARAPLSREELRAAALEVARAAQEAADEAAGPGGAEGGPEWKPVDLPKPSYVESAKAEREAPEPLEAPEQPKPASKVTLKPKPDTAPAPGVPTVPTARPAARGALGNLDAVLQRRRA